MRCLRPLVLLVLALGVTAAGAADNATPAAPAARAEKERTCFSAAESRNRIVGGGLADPFGIMRAKSRELRAEAISVRLCQIGPALVYEIDFLRPDGRLLHAYFEASSGKSWSARSEKTAN